MPNNILLPIDLGHEDSWRKAAPVAVSMAKQNSAKVHVMTVIPDYGMAVVGSFFPSDYAKDALAASETALNEFVEKHIPGDLLAGTTTVQGTIYKEIIAAADANDCDLIVLASHRPENKDFLLGPNAARVMRHAKQSVYVVRE